jgi:hypothetical protein
MKTNRITIAPIVLLVIIILSSVSTFSTSGNNNFFIYSGVYAQENGSDDNDTSQSLPYVGPNMKGFYTSENTRKDIEGHMPANYYEDSFRLIHDAGMNHVRFIFYWEAYEKNPSLFMKELDTVAQSAEKYGIKVIYDNHNYQTSSWLESIANGFPLTLFESNPDRYPHDSGGSIKYETAKIWWTDWWDRSVEDTNGNDGWALQLQFLKKIVNTVDSHPSTIGYEILNEPQIHSDNQWTKVGKYNTFMVDELRKITQKTIAYSQHIPTSMANNPTTSITMTPKNIAKMAPDNKSNVVFKFTLYGLPYDSKYQRDRLNILVKGAELAGVPLYIGEWNNVKREQVNDEESGIISYKIDRQASDIDQKKADLFIQEFKQLKVWGWAFWNWNYIPHPAPNLNLILIREDGSIDTTKYYEMLKNAVSDTA